MKQRALVLTIVLSMLVSAASTYVLMVYAPTLFVCQDKTPDALDNAAPIFTQQELDAMEAEVLGKVSKIASFLSDEDKQFIATWCKEELPKATPVLKDYAKWAYDAALNDITDFINTLDLSIKHPNQLKKYRGELHIKSAKAYAQRATQDIVLQGTIELEPEMKTFLKQSFFDNHICEITEKLIAKYTASLEYFNIFCETADESYMIKHIRIATAHFKRDLMVLRELLK